MMSYKELLQHKASWWHLPKREAISYLEYAALLEEIWVLTFDKQYLKKPQKVYREISKNLKKAIKKKNRSNSIKHSAFERLLTLRLLHRIQSTSVLFLRLLQDLPLLIFYKIPYGFRMAFAVLIKRTEHLKGIGDVQLLKTVIRHARYKRDIYKLEKNKKRKSRSGKNYEAQNVHVKLPEDLTGAWFIYFVAGNFLTLDQKRAWLLKYRSRFFDCVRQLIDLPCGNVMGISLLTQVLPETELLKELVENLESKNEAIILLNIAYDLNNEEMLRTLLKSIDHQSVNSKTIDIIEKTLLWVITHGLSGGYAVLIRSCLDYDYVHHRRNEALLAAIEESSLKDRISLFIFQSDKYQADEYFRCLFKNPYFDMYAINKVFKDARETPDRVFSKWIFSFLAHIYKVTVPYIEKSKMTDEVICVIWDDAKYAQPENCLKHYWKGTDNYYYFREIPQHLLLYDKGLIIEANHLIVERVQIEEFMQVKHSFSGSYAMLRTVLDIPEEDRSVLYPMAAGLLVDIICDKKWLTTDERQIDEIAHVAVLLENEFKVNTRKMLFDVLWREYQKQGNVWISQLYEKLVDLDSQYVYLNSHSQAGTTTLVQMYHKEPETVEPKMRQLVASLIKDNAYQDGIIWVCVELFKKTGLYIPYGKYLELFYDQLPSSFREDSELNTCLDSMGDNKRFIISRAFEKNQFNQAAVSLILRSVGGFQAKTVLEIVCRLTNSEYYKNEEIFRLIEDVYMQHPEKKMILAHLVSQKKQNRWYISGENLHGATAFRIKLEQTFGFLAK